MPSPTPLSGLLIFDKPLGWSSMKAVAVIRRRAGGVRTGHAGTLDPLATGVLVVALGAATKQIERLMATTKRYRTTIDLSAFSDTDDREGDRMEVEVETPPSRAIVDEALRAFTGTIQQRPPAFSAMKIGGRPAYKMARRGESVALAPRPVTVHSIACTRYEWPEIDVEIHCGKGFYVRSLARNLGEALGTGGHCASIRRAAVGPFFEAAACTAAQLPETIGEEHLLGLEAALARLAEDIVPAPPVAEDPGDVASGGAAP